MKIDPRFNALATADGFDARAFFALVQKVGHGRALGIEYRDAGKNWVELALPWREELVGVPDSGILASGAIVSLIDTAGGGAIWRALGRFEPLVTIDLRIEYLRPAIKGETVVAHCECYKTTRSIAFVKALAHGGDQNRPIAHASGTFMINP